MTRPLIILPEAEEELREAMRWYETRRAGLGLELVGVVERALVRIAETPAQFPGWPAAPRWRRAVLDRFPYAVVFEERAEGIEVVAVAHGKRRPGYWLARAHPP
jgi:toxin ParE1/3/4